jgi:hypothetical protein
VRPCRPDRSAGSPGRLAQRDVDAKTNEITQVKPLLDDGDITGALVAADALHVQRDTARYLVEQKEGDYLFTAVMRPARPVRRDHRWRLPQAGGRAKVEFAITQGQKGPQAENVKVIG